MAHVGRRLHFGDCDRNAEQFRIANVGLAQNIGERMTQYLADAQLALRGTFQLRWMAMPGHDLEAELIDQLNDIRRRSCAV